MGENNPLTLSGSTAGIKDVCHILRLRLCLTLFAFCIKGGVGVGKEFIQVNRGRVTFRTHHLGVKNNYLLERGARFAQRHHGVVLLLFAHKDVAHFSVVNHIRHLRRAACSKERNGDSANRVRPEVYEKTFGLIL